jgi:hypothetical protein
MPLYFGHVRQVSRPTDPGFGIPEGGRPDQGLPGWQPDGGLELPDQGLPAPPPGLWPPLTIGYPIGPAPPGTPPGTIWPSPGDPIGSGVFYVVAGIPGIGWRYVAVDPSLKPGMPLPPTAEPRR